MQKGWLKPTEIEAEKEIDKEKGKEEKKRKKKTRKKKKKIFTFSVLNKTSGGRIATIAQASFH